MRTSSDSFSGARKLFLRFSGGQAAKRRGAAGGVNSVPGWRVCCGGVNLDEMGHFSVDTIASIAVELKDMSSSTALTVATEGIFDLFLCASWLAEAAWTAPCLKIAASAAWGWKHESFSSTDIECLSSVSNTYALRLYSCGSQNHDRLPPKRTGCQSQKTIHVKHFRQISAHGIVAAAQAKKWHATV